MTYDILILGGLIADGQGGQQPYPADVGISGQHIQHIGQLADMSAGLVIQAKGKVVCPGFVDVHGHSDYTLLLCPQAESKVRQGVTTEVIGNCGYAAAPIWGQVQKERHAIYAQQYNMSLDWDSFSQYCQRLSQLGLSINVAPLVGYNTLRASAMGLENRPPSPEEFAAMRQALEEALAEGAFGLSAGLIYPPAFYAKTDELAEVIKTVARQEAVFTCHIRSEGPGLVEAVQEMIDIARQTGASVQISHLKTAGERNWRKLDRILNMLEAARSEGLRISADRYPYIASNTGLAAILPDWVFQGGIEQQLKRLTDSATRQTIREEILSVHNHPEPEYWDKVVIARLTQAGNQRYEGLTLAQSARIAQKDNLEFLFDLLIDERLQGEALYFVMSEKNLRRILKLPYVSIGSDSSCLADYGPLSQGRPHPRSFGTFPRVLGQYVREEGILSLGEAVHKMTYLNCQKLGLHSRGRIMEGQYADIVVFDPETIKDTATYSQPFAYPEGIAYVIVNGKVVVESGKHTSQTPGQILTKV